jgi:hypothetical protein
MYWCKAFSLNTKLLCCVFLCVSGLAACRPDVHETTGNKRYFDLKKFINADSARLNKAHLLVSKTVSHNDDAEQTREINIKNWGQELGLFSASDINKPSWKDSYVISNRGDSVIYTAKDDQLVTRRVCVKTVKGQVKKISIDNYTKNILYQTKEHLVYFPDSLYIIDKLQQVKLIGSNRYLIKGKIIK